ncbi:MAG: division/cell wall cluster transcriptional repressor MraZ [Alphaproteobacteria bacterium]|nr:division/cell wall cluster transcriptional repressor MraZ [Alphaproteobacteria bacterium]
MALFLSTFVNKVDKKGRVSVPASFRTVLSTQHFSGIVAYSSFVNPCIEACGMDRIEKLHESIDALDPFSEERDAFAATILGGSLQLPFDGEGRVMLPELLLGQAKISDKALFVGKGATFEIWEPEAFESYSVAAREKALQSRQLLRTRPSNGGGA